jgi:hypothetical protein
VAVVQRADAATTACGDNWPALDRVGPLLRDAAAAIARVQRAYVEATERGVQLVSTRSPDRKSSNDRSARDKRGRHGEAFPGAVHQGQACTLAYRLFDRGVQPETQPRNSAMTTHEGLSAEHTKAGHTQRAVLALLREHAADDALPTSATFIFYELEQRGLATKPHPDDTRPNRRRERGWPPGRQDVLDAVTQLRERGIVHWEWIVDESRQLVSWQHAPTVVEFVRATIEEARINPWGLRAPPVILCESRATAGVLERVAAEYCSPIAGTAGQCAGFLRTTVASVLCARQQVLSLGDLDLSGKHIEANTRRVLENEIGEELRWSRLGMTEELAAAHRIEPFRKTDGRSRQVHDAIEVEALGQAEVVALVRVALEELAPVPLPRVLERERRERERLAAYLDRFRTDE